MRAGGGGGRIRERTLCADAPPANTNTKHASERISEFALIEFALITD
jgi:hypothetical protein